MLPNVEEPQDARRRAKAMTRFARPSMSTRSPALITSQPPQARLNHEHLQASRHPLKLRWARGHPLWLRTKLVLAAHRPAQLPRHRIDGQTVSLILQTSCHCQSTSQKAARQQSTAENAARILAIQIPDDAERARSSLQACERSLGRCSPCPPSIRSGPAHRPSYATSRGHVWQRCEPSHRRVAGKVGCGLRFREMPCDHGAGSASPSCGPCILCER